VGEREIYGTKMRTRTKTSGRRERTKRGMYQKGRGEEMSTSTDLGSTVPSPEGLGDFDRSRQGKKKKADDMQIRTRKG